MKHGPCPEEVLEACPASLLRELTRPWAPQRGDRVLVACSGGADSVALLHLLAALAPGRGLALAVASLDHGLRGREGAQDLRFVRDLAKTLELPVIAERRRVAGSGARFAEDAARRVRHGFLREAATRLDCRVIALAHTLDDQAETLLQRLGRGSGLAGLGAMARLAEDRWRPLLRVRRRHLREILTALRLGWREDASNASPDPLRNRIRAELLPAVERVLGDTATQGLARAAELAGDDDRLLDELAAAQGPDFEEDSSGELRLERAPLVDLPAPLLRRILRRALVVATRGRVRGTSAHLFAMEDLVRAKTPGTRLDLPGGVRVWRRAGWIRIGVGVGESDTNHGE